MKRREINKKKLNLILFIIVFILIILTSFFAIFPKVFNDTIGVVITPIQGFFTSFAENTSDKINSMKDKDFLKKEYEDTMILNEELVIEINRLKKLDEENKELTSLLDTVSTYPELPTLTSKIIGKDTSNWHSTYIIDKGAKDGLEPNMIVLSYGGLFGRIVEVSEFSSKVVTILDDSASISVENARTQELALLKGDITLMSSKLCKIEYYNSDADMLLGDEIVTSKISSIYPAGISVGHIVSLEDSHGQLTQTALIDPVVDFTNISTVLVVTELFTKSTNVTTETITSLNDVTLDRNAGE